MEGKLCFLSKASIAWIFSQIASVDSFEKGERVLPSVFLLLQSALDLESSQWRWFYIETLPKAQRTRGLSSSYQSNFLRSYHKFKHKSWSHFIFRSSTKHQPGLHQSSLLNRSEWVSQLVSEWVTDKHCQWSDSSPIKICNWVNIGYQ